MRTRATAPALLLQVIKKTMHGAPIDQLADVEERVQAERTASAAWMRELEQLEEQRRLADDYEAALELDEAIARARWTVERANARIPQLESERDRALADRRRDLLARHKAAIGKNLSAPAGCDRRGRRGARRGNCRTPGRHC
jgi:chromosome segregation ATPase